MRERRGEVSSYGLRCLKRKGHKGWHEASKSWRGGLK